MPERKPFEFTTDARNAKVKLNGAPAIRDALENAKLWVASISSPRLPRARVLVNKQSVVTSYEEKSENAEGISTMHLGWS